MLRFRLLLIPLFFLVFVSSGFAGPVEKTPVVSVAVAANFGTTFDKIVKAFQKQSKIRVEISLGSTGLLYAQITNGAPYDIFLSADKKRPFLLEKNKQIIQGSRFTYAYGQLALWDPGVTIKDAHAAREILNSRKFHYLALAQPKSAPYGLAAQQALMKMRLYEELRHSLVYGLNIGQTFSYVKSGNAEIGFVANSQVLGNKSVWLVPRSYYSPIKQQAVLLLHASNNVAARKLFNFMKTKQVRKIIIDSGYYL